MEYLKWIFRGGLFWNHTDIELLQYQLNLNKKPFGKFLNRQLDKAHSICCETTEKWSI